MGAVSRLDFEKAVIIHEADIERLILFKIGRYRSHPDWEDIQQEARIRAWRSLERTKGQGWAPSTVVCHAAYWAAVEWFRRKQPRHRWARMTPEQRDAQRARQRRWRREKREG